MLLIAVLSFICGVYCEALYFFNLKILAILLFPCIFIIPFIINKFKIIVIILIFFSFFLTGMIRTAISIMDHKISSTVINNLLNKNTIYEGYVTESAMNIKTLKIEISPDFLKTAFATDLELNIGDKIIIYGHIKEIIPTFKNPHVKSWKWLKKMEGINYEIKGRVIKVLYGDNTIQKLRKNLKNNIDNSNAKYREVIKALTIGDKQSIDEKIIDLFLKTGTSHILAISGLHVGIITGFFFCIIRWLLGRFNTLGLSGRHTEYASIATIPFPFIFMIISGSSISTIRAAIMIAIFMFSLFLERQRDLINTIAISALIILLLYPHSIFMPSFQLSFMSVLFIVLIMRKLYPRIKIKNRYVKWCAISILTTISATIGTLPVVIYHFYGINPFSMFFNLLAIPPMCMIAIPLSFIGMILPHGEYLLRIAGEIISLNVNVLSYINIGYIFPVIRPDLFEILLYYAIILGIIFFRYKIVFGLLLFIVIPLTAIQILFAVKDRFNNDISINLIDVGMGESIIVEAPKGIRMLIDSGGDFRGNFDAGRAVVTPVLLSKKILTLDYVINTHPHGDHAGGLPFVLNTFKVKNFISGGYYINNPIFIEIMKILKNKKINILLWKEGDRINMFNGLKIIVMNPPEYFSGYELNNASLVLKFLYKDISFLLTGDIDSEIEEKLLLSGLPLISNIIKIPHHGSRTSSSFPFLFAVKPEIAVLSTGSGIKGLPSEETIQRYKRLSIPVLRTDKNGFIRITSDGAKITNIMTYR